jgi:chromosomal replication initiator protein
MENHLRSEYRFSNFVVGKSNRLAHAAALSVSNQLGTAYNPLFVYGGVGLGKTHLLHAIGHQCRDNGQRVLYVTAERFTNDLVQAIRRHDMDAFRRRYRNVEVLLVDDVQLIAGKESTQEELFHTFNELHRQGRQVILSSDRAPRAMATLEERLRSRFEWGLMADIQHPDDEMRLAILHAKVRQAGLEVPEAVLQYVAQLPTGNVRELEGALNKVVAFAQVTGSTVDVQQARSILAHLAPQRNQVTVADVIAAVARHYGLTISALCGSSRTRTISMPRQICMYLARTETSASLPQIGAALGNRDHTTVLYGYGKIAGAVTKNADLRDTTSTIRSILHANL